MYPNLFVRSEQWEMRSYHLINVSKSFIIFKTEIITYARTLLRLANHRKVKVSAWKILLNDAFECSVLSNLDLYTVCMGGGCSLFLKCCALEHARVSVSGPWRPLLITVSQTLLLFNENKLLLHCSSQMKISFESKVVTVTCCKLFRQISAWSVVTQGLSATHMC